jgi:hypothetical protein
MIDPKFKGMKLLSLKELNFKLMSPVYPGPWYLTSLADDVQPWND